LSYRIIGHRGNKAKFIENTLAGFQSILQNPDIDGFELDVVMSKDKKLLISHDRFITDPSGKKHYIHNLTYNELLTLGKISHIAEKQKGIRYPLLEDVLKLYANQPHKKMILLEIKSIPSSGTLPLSISQFVKSIHNLLEAFDIHETCTIISFDYRIIKESYKLSTKQKVGLILHHNLIPIVSIAETLHISMLVMAKDWITQEQVTEMRKCNIDIFTWTPNTEKEWLRLSTLGVKGLITDKPEALSIFSKDIRNEI